MKKIYFCCLLVLLLSLPEVCLSAASTRGMSGMIDTPTADVLGGGRVNAAAYKLHDGHVQSLAVGVGRRLEIAAAANSPDNGSSVNELHFKYALRQESIIKPGLAVGIDDVADERERSVYAVMSKALPWGIRMNVGLGSGHYNGAFGSLEKQVIKGRLGKFPTTMLIVEHDGRNMNYGLRLSLSPRLHLLGGYRSSDSYIGISGSF